MEGQSKRYAVMLECRTGTWHMDYSRMQWVDDYHTITWCVETDLDIADQTLRDLLAGDPARREIKGAWIEEVSK